MSANKKMRGFYISPNSKVEKWLENQENRSQSIELAIKYVMSIFGDGDLPSSMVKTLVDQKTHKRRNVRKQVTKALNNQPTTTNADFEKEKKAEPAPKEDDQPSFNKATKSTDQPTIQNQNHVKEEKKAEPANSSANSTANDSTNVDNSDIDLGDFFSQDL